VVDVFLDIHKERRAFMKNFLKPIRTQEALIENGNEYCLSLFENKPMNVHSVTLK
jgi:hypothetical protein